MPELTSNRAVKLLSQDSALPLLARKPREFVNAFRWPLAVMVLGASADLFTTLWNMRTYGAGIEVHVVQQWFSLLFGVEVGVPLAKMGQCAFVIVVAAWWRRWCKWLMLGCGCLYAMAAVSNYFLLF